MTKTRVNGCLISSFSKSSQKCRSCNNREYCQYKNKRETHDYMNIMLMTNPNWQLWQQSVTGAGISVQEANEALQAALAIDG